jgi:hypothetical protein
MTNNKQQTAVEMMWDEIDNLFSFKDSVEAQKFCAILDKYKEMDKEQKIRDFTDGYLYRGEQLRPWLIDKWYNETYGGGEQ